eukprot:661133-Pleurochrysis_carterae.AAC.1
MCARVCEGRPPGPSEQDDVAVNGRTAVRAIRIVGSSSRTLALLPQVLARIAELEPFLHGQ